VGPADFPGAKAAYLDFARALVEIEGAARSAALSIEGLSERARDEAARAVSEAQSGYLSDHRTQDKGLGMLAKMFGAAWASRYIDAVLFPAGDAAISR
jgi:hypothetical protein